MAKSNIHIYWLRRINRKPNIVQCGRQMSSKSIWQQHVAFHREATRKLHGLFMFLLSSAPSVLYKRTLKLHRAFLDEKDCGDLRTSLNEKFHECVMLFGTNVKWPNSGFKLENVNCNGEFFKFLYSLGNYFFTYSAEDSSDTDRQIEGNFID